MLGYRRIKSRPVICCSLMICLVMTLSGCQKNADRNEFGDTEGIVHQKANEMWWYAPLLAYFEVEIPKYQKSTGTWPGTINDLAKTKIIHLKNGRRSEDIEISRIELKLTGTAREKTGKYKYRFDRSTPIEKEFDPVTE